MASDNSPAPVVPRAAPAPPAPLSWRLGIAAAILSQILAAYALTGFANFASIGIQLGGIGAIAPARHQDLARLGGRALFVGFVATLLNAALVGVLMP